MQHHHGLWRPGSGERLGAAHVASDNPIMRGQTATPGRRPHDPGAMLPTPAKRSTSGRIDLGHANGCTARVPAAVCAAAKSSSGARVRCRRHACTTTRGFRLCQGPMAQPIHHQHQVALLLLGDHPGIPTHCSPPGYGTQTTPTARGPAQRGGAAPAGRRRSRWTTCASRAAACPGTE